MRLQVWKIPLAIVAGVIMAPSLWAATLIHHWTFDSSGNDSVGGAHLTLETGSESAVITSTGAGVFGEALSVPQSSVAAVISDSPDLPVSDFTFVTWVRIDPSSPDDFLSVMGNQGGGATSGVFMRVDNEGADGDLFGRVNGPGELIEGGTVDTNVWTHLAMTVSSTSGLTIYVNGSSVGNNPLGTSHNTNNSGQFAIGRRADSTSQDFWGLIDDAAIYNGVLTTTEISNAMNFGAQNFAIPEPSSTLLAGIGALGLLMRRRRHARS